MIVDLQIHNQLSNAEKGQLLIEAIIAIGLIIIGLTGVLAFLSSSLSLNRVVSDQLVGTYLAEEGVELTKNILDSNLKQGNPWNYGFTQDQDYLVDNSNQSLRVWLDTPLLYEPNKASTHFGYNYESGRPTIFKRTIHITPIGSNEIQVKSIVKWSERGGQFTIELDDHFFNWRT